MIPVFVISLSDSTERRQTIAERLDRLGIAFAFQDAVDGRLGLDPVWERQIDRAGTAVHGRILTDAEYGCALSHIEVYRRIVTAAIPHALVLEDDAVPGPALYTFLQGKHYSDADVVNLDPRSSHYVRRRNTKKLFGDHVSYVLAPRLKNYGTAAYAVSLKAARHFVDHAVPVTWSADWPHCAEDIIARQQWRVVMPAVCQSLVTNVSTIGNNPSTIGLKADPTTRPYRRVTWRKLLYKRVKP